MLEKYGVTLYEGQVIDHLLYQIISPDTELKTEVNICRSSHSLTFFKSSTYLSTVIARLYLYAKPSSGRFKKRSIYDDGHGDCGDGRGESFNGRGRGRGHGEIGGRGR